MVIQFIPGLDAKVVGDRREDVVLADVAVRDRRHFIAVKLSVGTELGQPFLKRTELLERNAEKCALWH